MNNIWCKALILGIIIIIIIGCNNNNNNNKNLYFGRCFLEIEGGGTKNCDVGY